MHIKKTKIHQLFKTIDSEMDLLLALGEHVSSELNLDILLQLVADSAKEVIDAKTLVVPIIDFEKDEYHYLSASGDNAKLIINHSFPLSVGMCGWVLSNQKALLFGRGSDLPIGNKTVWEEGMESAVLVPLISHGKIIGGLSGLGKKNNNSFTQRDLELLTLIANQTSAAIQNAQIHQQLQQQQQKLEEVLNLTRFEKEQAEVTLEAIADAVVITDTNRKILNFNNSAELITGFKKRDAIGKTVEQIIPVTGWDNEHDNHPVFEALQDDCMVRISNVELISSNNNQIKIDGSVSILRDDSYHAIGSVMLFRDISEQHKMMEKIHHYATYDQLTGLVNRREFEIRLNNALQSAIKEHKRHVLCYMDLDQFKIVNDTCGHAAGDELLRQLSSVLTNHVRERDTLSRIGGDEFGLLLENCSLNDATNIAELIRQDIEDFRFSWSKKSFKLGVSLGLVMINDKSTTINALLSAADQACYMAKEQGRNQVKIYTESDKKLTLRSNEMHWVSRLHEALMHDHFELFYQPIISVQNTNYKKQEYYELLIRLHDSENKIMPPGSFLPAAERYGLMTAIDQWVIKNYFIWLKKNPEHLNKLKKCSINLSAQSLCDKNLLKFIKQQIEKYNIPANKLCFEITETAVISNLNGALKCINSLRKLGISFSLDDFGTGMSSFSYLKKLPIDNIKIDGSFIKDILVDKVDETLVNSIIDIGKVMNKETIAEYVESVEILEKIKELGIDYAQGYGIAKPESLRNITTK
ncbi:MAG: EAL domain-containing protein [Gammaproteobacteria bacterium]|nr:EAL domain-containing protein [Gammaproteobacteria bacterium]